MGLKQTLWLLLLPVNIQYNKQFNFSGAYTFCDLDKNDVEEMFLHYFSMQS